MTALDRGTLAGPTLGPVDLVAVDRVRHGYHAELSDAEERYLYSTGAGRQGVGGQRERGAAADRAGESRAATLTAVCCLPPIGWLRTARRAGAVPPSG